MIKKILNYAVAAVLVLGAGGCMAQKESASMKQKILPSWYESPPRSTASTLYAIGEGENREEALKNALNMMASTLSVSISSQFDSKKVVREGLVNTSQSTVLSRTQSDVQKIRISSYELMESQKIGFNNHVVLISSQKKKLFESLKSELEQRFALAESRIASLQAQNALYRLGGYKNIERELSDVPGIIVVMNVLDGSYKGEEYLQKIQDIHASHEKLLLDITVFIDCDGDSKRLEAPIKEGFSAVKMRIERGGGSEHFEVKVSSNVQKASSYGFTIARFAVEISVEDAKGSVVASNKLNIIGQSTQGYETAKESAAQKLEEMIKKEGIYKVVGIYM